MTQTPTARELMEAALRAHQAGELSEAAEFYRRFLGLRPGQPDALSNLGNALLQLGRPEEAVEVCRQAVAARPAFAEAYLNMGMALQKLGRLAEAIEAYRRALAVRADFVPALNGLGTALQQNGQLDEAASTFRIALALAPGYRDALNNLGNTLRESGQIEAAVEVFREALAHNPTDAELLNNLGIALEAIGQLGESEKTYRRAIAARAGFAPAHYNLGNLLQKDNVDQAIESFQTALRIDPDLTEAWINLGNALCDAGRSDEAFEHYRRGVAVRPNSRFAGTLIYAMNFDPAVTPEQVREEQSRWNREYAQPLRHLVTRHTNDRSPGRKLSIGYVSPDLGNHPVGRFMLPLLSHHDHGQFEIYCYSDAARLDAVGARNQSYADVWRTTVKLPDEQIAAQIRQDQIDILVDLTMHASANRLLVFARKPAPLQVSYLAYPGSTGLETIDYRLTDPYIDPPDQPERDRNYSEKSVRLPHTFWCYAPPPEAGDVGPLPALASGQITFGCLNSFSKVSSLIFDTWIRLLDQVSGSRLLLHSRRGSHQRRLRDRLSAAGIDPQRLQFVGFLPTAEYFREYEKIDIALDSFPYAGGTTTCDALWMGVPVVTLAGQTAISRGGASILSNIGLGRLVAQSTDQYVSIATQLAGDLPSLAQLRSGMRARMLGSLLMDAAGFARDVEAAYRQMWQAWCASPIRDG